MSTPPPPGGHPVPPADEPAPPYQGYPPYPYAPTPGYGPPHQGWEQPPSQAQAGWALGLAIVPCCLTSVVAIVLAVGVLSRSREDGRDHGRGLAFGALGVAGAWILLTCVVAVLGGLPGPGPEAQDEPRLRTPLGQQSAHEIGVGECFDSPELLAAAPGEDTEAAGVTATPCDGPHFFEAYHAFDLAAGDTPERPASGPSPIARACPSSGRSSAARWPARPSPSRRSTPRGSPGTAGTAPSPAWSRTPGSA